MYRTHSGALKTGSTLWTPSQYHNWERARKSWNKLSIVFRAVNKLKQHDAKWLHPVSLIILRKRYWVRSRRLQGAKAKAHYLDLNETDQGSTSPKTQSSLCERMKSCMNWSCQENNLILIDLRSCWIKTLPRTFIQRITQIIFWTRPCGTCRFHFMWLANMDKLNACSNYCLEEQTHLACQESQGMKKKAS